MHNAVGNSYPSNERGGRMERSVAGRCLIHERDDEAIENEQASEARGLAHNFSIFNRGRMNRVETSLVFRLTVTSRCISLRALRSREGRPARQLGVESGAEPARCTPVALPLLPSSPRLAAATSRGARRSEDGWRPALRRAVGLTTAGSGGRPRQRPLRLQAGHGAV